MKTLADWSQSKDNNFNLLRMLCALGVLLAHSHLVFTGSSLNWVVFSVRIDHLFVAIFFAISGFLICRSLLSSQDLKRYFIARAARILPALIAIIGITVFVAGPIFTTLPLGSYFNHTETWQYLLNLNLLNIHTQFTLPSVFEKAPFIGNVNASLWTLPIEVWLYAMMAMSYCLALISADIFSKASPKQLWSWLVGFGTTLLLLISVFGEKATQTRDDDAGIMLIFICVFLTGALLYVARDQLTLKLHYAVALWLITWAAEHTALFIASFSLSITYSVLLIAYRPHGRIRLYNRLGDYSYGTYIYGFLVQQSTLATWPQISFLAFVALSSAVTLLCALVSWHCLERPCLQFFKQRD